MTRVLATHHPMRLATRAAAIRRTLSAVVVLVTIVVAVPAGLIGASRAALSADHPLPGIGTRSEISEYFERGLSNAEIVPIAMRVLLIVGWLLWLLVVVALVGAITDARGVRPARWPRVSVFHGFARWVAVGLFAWSSFTSTIGGLAHAVGPAGVSLPFVTAAAAATPPVIERPVADGHARVLAGETAETFAARVLGAAERWTELWELNGDRPVGPDGECWTTAWKLGAGWDLQLPAGSPSPDALIDESAAFLPDRDELPQRVVERGDSYWSIATDELGPRATGPEIFDYTERLVAFNAPHLGYDDPTLIDVGDSVALLPHAAATADEPVTTEEEEATPLADHEYVVVAGDSYWSIAEQRAAQQHGPDSVDASVVYGLMLDLIDLNAPRLGHDDRELLHPGEVVWLYDPATAETASSAPGPDDDEVAATTGAVLATSVAAAVSDVVATDAERAELGETIVDAGAVIERSVAAVALAPPTGTPVDEPAPAAIDHREHEDDGAPIGVAEVGMVATGLVTLLAVRRRRRLRRAEPPARVPLPSSAAVATERSLRAVSAEERLLRTDIALRAAAAGLVDTDVRVQAVRCGPAGQLELVLSGVAEAPAPFVGHGDRWELPSAIGVDQLAASSRRAGAPCVALAPVGLDEAGWEVLVDLEAVGVLAIEAAADVADDVVRAIAVGLASSEFAEISHLITVDLDAAAVLEHHNAAAADDVDAAVELAATLVGSESGDGASTFVRRARQTGGELWEPAVVLVGSADAAALSDDVIEAATGGHRLAVVVAGACPRANWKLVAPTEPTPTDGSSSAMWELAPLGVQMRPVGIDREQLDLLDELTAIDVDDAMTGGEVASFGGERSPVLAGAGAFGAPFTDDRGGFGAPTNGRCVSASDVDLAGDDDDDTSEVDDRVIGDAAVTSAPPWALQVRLLGSVDVVDADGTTVDIERAKTLELLAWMTTHRDRATRGRARAALWELDVRDATFANVVSDARRRLAKHVAPPDGDEWVRRTLTDALELNDGVVTDVDVVEAAVAAARDRPPAEVVEILRPAVELVRGMPFSDTSYLWADAEGITSNLVLLATSVVADYARAALDLGDIDGVFWSTGKGLEVIAGQEHLIALRMRAHGDRGDRAGVRVEWEAYERVLTADPWSDGEPSPKLAALRARLLSPAQPSMEVPDSVHSILG